MLVPYFKGHGDTSSGKGAVHLRIIEKLKAVVGEQYMAWLKDVLSCQSQEDGLRSCRNIRRTNGHDLLAFSDCRKVKGFRSRLHD